MSFGFFRVSSGSSSVGDSTGSSSRSQSKYTTVVDSDCPAPVDGNNFFPEEEPIDEVTVLENLFIFDFGVTIDSSITFLFINVFFLGGANDLETVSCLSGPRCASNHSALTGGFDTVDVFDVPVTHGFFLGFVDDDFSGVFTTVVRGSIG